jgi:3'(2'), 5'-bisphosphate nucleotidase
MTADAAMGEALADIVVGAAKIILPYWRSGLEVIRKADESPVTQADREAETYILGRLAAEFPDIPVISEEDASEFGTPEAIGPRFFLVDPLDGTKAFVRGDPSFTVNIGLVQDYRAVAGAIQAPVSDEVWWTTAAGVMRRVKGGPAERVQVRPRPANGGLALVSHTASAQTKARLAAAHGFQDSQPMDSSIKFCRLAEGSADLYPREGPTMEWDTCAGQAILEAAGGGMAMPDGGPFLYGKADAKFRNGGFVARGG